MLLYGQWANGLTSFSEVLIRGGRTALRQRERFGVRGKVVLDTDVNLGGEFHGRGVVLWNHDRFGGTLWISSQFGFSFLGKECPKPANLNAIALGKKVGDG